MGVGEGWGWGRGECPLPWGKNIPLLFPELLSFLGNFFLAFSQFKLDFPSLGWVRLG
jgi:hypothetical protein